MGSSARRVYGAAEQEAIVAREAFAGSAFLLARMTEWLAAVVATRGRLIESDELWATGANLQEENGSAVEALLDLVLRVKLSAVVRGQGGLDALDAALERFPLSDMDPVERPYLEVAEAFALVGDPAAASALVDEFERTTPANFQRGLRYDYHRVLGEIARAEGRFDDAIAEFRQSASRPQELMPMIGLARTFDAAGQADSAGVHYRRFLEQPHWLGVFPHMLHLANALVRLAELEEEAGDLEAAALLYAEFVELWEDADPELQPRVEAAQQRLEEIIAERG
jgi:tetratricopeptide (TPR) repeat protein